MHNQQGPTVQHMELSSVLCGSLDGRGGWGRMDTSTCRAQSLCYSPETTTTLLTGHESESGSHSDVSNSVTLWTVAHQAPLSVRFSRQEYWSRVPFPIPADLPNPGIKPVSLCLLHCLVDSLPLAPPGKPYLVERILKKSFLKFILPFKMNTARKI